MIEDYTALSNAPNSPDLNGKYLGLISSDFIKVSEALKEAATILIQHFMLFSDEMYVTYNGLLSLVSPYFSRTTLVENFELTYLK